MKKSFTPLEKNYTAKKPRSLTGSVRKGFSNRTGFTLIELIVVIAIIAILAAIIAPNAFKAIENAKVAQAISDFKAYKTATFAFYADTRNYPKAWELGAWEFCLTDNGFTSNVDGWLGWDGPYLEIVRSEHPWGGMYCLNLWETQDGNPRNELMLQLNSACYPAYLPGSPGTTYDCGISEKSAKRMDEALDDGNLSARNFRRGAPTCCAAGGTPWSQLCTCWILSWNVQM